MKSCKEINELISLYIDGELNKAEIREFEEHIGTCAKCKEEVKIQMEIIDLCNNIEDVELPKDFNKQLHQKLVSENQRKGPLFWKNSKYIKLVSSIAAVFLLIFISSELLSREKSFDNYEMLSDSASEMYAESSEEDANLFSLDDISGKRADIDDTHYPTPSSSNGEIDLDIGQIVVSEGAGKASKNRNFDAEDEEPFKEVVDIDDNEASNEGYEASNEGYEASNEDYETSNEGWSGEDVYIASTELADTWIKASIINKSLKLEDMDYIMDTATKLEINLVVDGQIKTNKYISDDENTVLVEFTTDKNKYNRFIEELKGHFANITTNIIIDEETEKIVEILIK